MQNRPAFEIPYSEISNTNLAGKNEVAVEFSLPAGGAETGTNGHLGGARSRGRKAGAAKDQLVEMRFYIPGTVAKKEKDEDGEEKSVDGSEVEEQNAASLFYETLMDKAEIGEVAGDTFATFLDVLHLTPRWVKLGVILWRELCADDVAEDASMSTCTKIRSGCAARLTTTRSSMSILRSSCFCLSQTICIILLRLVWIRLFDRVRLDTLSL